MGFIGAIKNAVRNRINFTGRASRSEFWNYILFIILFSIFITVAMLLMNLSYEDAKAPSILVLILILGAVIPGIALTARRMHDLDRPGAWSLVNVVPILGQLIFLVWMLKRGTPGPNQFGGDPLEAKTPSAVAAAA